MAESKLEKVNDSLYVEHWKEDAPSLNWFKHAEHLWMTLHDIELVSGFTVDDSDKEPQFPRRIAAIAKFETKIDVQVWEPAQGSSRFECLRVAIHEADSSSEADRSVLMHMVGDVLKYGFEPEPPHLALELHVAKAMFAPIWMELTNTMIAKATLDVTVEVFRSELDRSLSEPWHRRTYCIENDSTNTAVFCSLYLQQPTVLPAREGLSKNH